MKTVDPRRMQPAAPAGGNDLVSRLTAMLGARGIDPQAFLSRFMPQQGGAAPQPLGAGGAAPAASAGPHALAVPQPVERPPLQGAPAAPLPPVWPQTPKSSSGFGGVEHPMSSGFGGIPAKPGAPAMMPQPAAPPQRPGMPQMKPSAAAMPQPAAMRPPIPQKPMQPPKPMAPQGSPALAKFGTMQNLQKYIGR